MISVRSAQGEETIPLDEFESRVRQGLIAPSTLVRFPVLTGEQWVDARELELFRRLYAPARIHFTRAFSLGRFPWLTTALVVLQVVLFFGIAGAQRILALDPLIQAGAKIPANILELGETWRLLTANLLHRDILHLLFNMFFLFNVGGTIENAYRLRDYALILIASAVATTVLSTLLSNTPSVGASGMVLGLFGSASVFGYKYSDILPARYRRYFGGAVLPYALFILYVGLANKDTDNWGHLGGMLGGLFATVFLDPKLLHVGRAPEPIMVRMGPIVASTVIVGAVLVSGPLLRAMGPSYEEVSDPKSGLRFVHPDRWRSVEEDHLGYPAWGNNTLGVGIGVTAERRTARPWTIEEVRRRFVHDELRGRERDGDIASVEIADERPFLIRGGIGKKLEITLESRVGPLITRNYLIARGYYSYAIVVSARAEWAPDYAPIFDAMEKEITLIEPESLTAAKQRVAIFPGQSSEHVELANQLASIGEVQAAAQSYQRALEALPELPEALFGLAKLAADYEGDLARAEAIAGELHRGSPEDAGYAALLADLRKRLGQIDGACAVLQETLDRVPDPPEDLRERLVSLGCSPSSAWNDP